jgi:hypothetical protein
MFKRQALPDAASLLVRIAKSHIGFQAAANNRTTFGEAVGYNSQPWAGAFVDVCIREAGLLKVPACIQTASAIAEFLRNGQIQSRPLPGDIVFFNFASTASAFGMPHCGIVVDVREYDATGKFLTVEGNVNNGHPRYEFDYKDGVYQRVRHQTDVLMFARVAPQLPEKLLTNVLKLFRVGRPTLIESQEIQDAAKEQLKVEPEMIKPPRRNKQIELVQLALSTVVDLKDAKRGQWDFTTMNAFARYQRNIGHVGDDADGIPNIHTLQRLARDTGLFQVKDY